MTAAYLTTAFVVGGVGAWHLLRGHDTPQVRTAFSMAMWMAAIVAPFQLLAGHEHGVNTLEHQPTKIMAMEGHFRDYPDGAPLYLFGIPDQGAQRLDHAVAIPHLGSLILKGDPYAPVKGLNNVPRADQPPVAIVFWSFRIMVGIGMAMIAIGLWSLWARWRRTLFAPGWLHRAALVMGPSGFVAVIAGWVTTEIGRQPYTIYGVLRTVESVAPIGVPSVAASLLAFIVVYTVVFGFGVWYILRLMSAPPYAGEAPLAGTPTRTAGTTPAAATGGDGAPRPDALATGEAG